MVTRSPHGPDTPLLGHVDWSGALRRLANQYGQEVAVNDGHGHNLTYRQLHDYAHAVANVLFRQLELRAGEAVATLLPNTPAAVWASYGVRLGGATEVPVGYSSTLDEVVWCARLAGFRYVLTTTDRMSDLRDAGLEPIDIQTIELNQNIRVGFEAVPGHLPGRIIFTSGTTGRPKGMVYSHAKRWTGEQLLKATLPFVPKPGDRIVLMTPFVHGSSLLTYAWCDYGAQVVLLKGVDEVALRALLPDPTVKAVFAPPTVLVKLTDLFQGQRFDHVQCVFTGTQPLTPAIYQRAQAMFGPVVRITYGKSECVNPITVLTPQQTQAYYQQQNLASGACVGFAAPGVELRIDNPDPDNDQGADGEIWLRARQMSDGALTADGFKAHGPDGWHQTGDLGYLDDEGRLVLTGRVADVIKTGGYRVNPDEIEALLTGWPDAMQVSVLSLPSDYWGEIIIAAAENPVSDWTEQARDRVASLSRYKHPRLYVQLPKLPRNPQGKVNRRIVREHVLAHYQLVDGPYPSLEPLMLSI